MFILEVPRIIRLRASFLTQAVSRVALRRHHRVHLSHTVLAGQLRPSHSIRDQANIRTRQHLLSLRVHVFQDHLRNLNLATPHGDQAAELHPNQA